MQFLSNVRNGSKADVAIKRLIDEHQRMVSQTIQAEVISVLAEERGLPPDKIHLSHRLLQDLGMDGDDAVDFFNRLHVKFGTDLTVLDERWSAHFGPEGSSCWNGIVIVPAAIVGGVVTGVAGLSVIWGIALTCALVAGWLWAMRRWPASREVPITVGEVVAAVEAGVWPK